MTDVLRVPGTDGKKLISNSSRNTFTKCPRYFKMHALDGVRRVQDELPLSVGSLVHEMLLHFYKGDNVDSLIDQIVAWRDAEITKSRLIETPDYNEDEIGKRAEIACDVMSRYVDAYGDDVKHYSILAAEMPFVVPIPQWVGSADTRKMRVDPLFAYTGKFDLVVRDNRTNQVFVIDHKTTTLSDMQRFEQEIELGGAGQRVGYVYAARFFFENVTGIMYNVLRMKIPSSPKTVQCRKCKGDGCAACFDTGYSGLSKVVPDTTLRVFDKTIAELQQANPAVDLSLAAELREEISRKGERFLYRFYSATTQAEIERWADDMYDVSHAMLSAMRDERWYRNLAACSVNGRKCSLLNVCAHGWEGNTNYKIVKSDPWIPGEVIQSDDETTEE